MTTGKAMEGLADEVCCYCEKTGDLRPYGPKGAMVCFKCMKSSPDRERQAASQFSMQMYHCNSDVIVGTKAGPVPFKPRKSS